MVQGVRFPLLLLWGLLGLLCPLWAQDTPFQKFRRQHVTEKFSQCDQAMRAVNSQNGYCKLTNTFLHDTLQNVIAVCTRPPITCSNDWKNCRQSAHPVRMTVCRVTDKKYPNCRYKATPRTSNFVVACDPPQQGDRQFREERLLPVHLDA